FLLRDRRHRFLLSRIVTCEGAALKTALVEPCPGKILLGHASDRHNESMKLHIGERLEGAGPAQQPGGYVVTAVVRETPWHGLYAGKKIFYNFDFTAKRVRETDDVEWLDVFLRTNRYPILDDPAYVQQRRALARAEVRAILGNRHSNLWPEPLDLLEIENTRDPFAFADDPARGGEPIIVYARPHGRFTPDWQQQILPIS